MGGNLGSRPGASSKAATKKIITPLKNSVRHATNSPSPRAVYYIPPSRVRLPLSTTPRSTFSEFHGAATYYAIMSPISAAEIINNRIWSYNEPPKEYEALKGYLAFYVGPWECYVDNERAHAPPGDYYGGWVTSDIEGLVKPPHQWGTGWDGVF